MLLSVEKNLYPLKNSINILLLTLIWVGFLGVRFEVLGVGDYPLSKTC